MDNVAQKRKSPDQRLGDQREPLLPRFKARPPFPFGPGSKRDTPTAERSSRRDAFSGGAGADPWRLADTLIDFKRLNPSSW
jgi:hypothetical protein